MLLIRPAAAHRVTVFGSTRKRAATSPGVSRRSLVLSTFSLPLCPALGAGGLFTSVAGQDRFLPCFRKRSRSVVRRTGAMTLGTRDIGDAVHIDPVLPAMSRPDRAAGSPCPPCEVVSQNMSDLVSLPEIERAAERIAGVAVRTPLVPFPRDPAAAAAGEPALLLKAESLQPIGAFKVRGAYAAISALSPAERERGVVTHSSGNHAQAVAYAARALGIKAVLVMPHTTPGVKVDACIALGAEVVYVEPTSQARAETAGKLADAHGFAMIPPYDDARVIAGQGTAGLEIVQDLPDVDVVLVPISGGGLIAGISAAVKALRPEAAVIGVEPELAADAR